MPDQPNFLFLFPDQWRWDWLGCESSPFGKVPVRTPSIDKLAARGVRFTNCRTNSPVCAPARACLSLGTRYEKCGVPSNAFDMDPTRTTVWQLLRNAGYRTLTSGKNDLHKRTRWKGLDGWTQLLGQYGFTDAIDQSGKLDAQGFNLPVSPHCSYSKYLADHDAFEAYRNDYVRRSQEYSHPTAPWPSPLPREHYTDDFCGRMAMKLLDRTPREGPWCLWVNFPGPHDPFDPPRELQQRYDGVEFPMPIAARDTYAGKPVDHQQSRRNYAAECEGIDEWVGRLVGEVEARGQFDNTIVIFCSDHGELLGDHGGFNKSRPEEGSVHVPLIVAGPGIEQGQVRNELVELIDIAAFMLERAMLPIPDTFDARPFLSLETPNRDVQVSSLGKWRMIFDGRHKLVIDETDAATPRRLYDLQTDPGELNDIAAANADLAASLAARLDRETRP